MDTNILQHWKAGEVIVLRGVRRKTVWWACPAITVCDTPELTAAYWPAGTLNMDPDRRPTPQDLLSNEVHLVPHTWVQTDVLMLVTPGSAHAVWIMRETGQAKLRCWYVNLQEPLRRTRLGFDSMDHFLDIVISPDRSTWRWKDEDEFEQAVAAGVYTAEQACAIRAEGERAIHLLETGQLPFCDGWETWSPPAEWQIPALPQGWDTTDIE